MPTRYVSIKKYRPDFVRGACFLFWLKCAKTTNRQVNDATKLGLKTMERTPITLGGLKKLETELNHLKSVERPAIIEAIATARDHGDLSENAEYSSAKEKQSFIEGRIQELEAKLSLADVIDPTKQKGTKVMFGATVKVVDVDTDKETTYALVGPDEADLEKGLISITSPLGRALIGKEEGDEAVFNAPGGTRTYEVLDVEYKAIDI